MPEKETLERARRDKREGKSPSTQAGEFVREEIHHVREGKHGARSPEQAIAIGLTKARRAGVELPPPKGEVARRAAATARRRAGKKPSPARSRASQRRLKNEGTSPARVMAAFISPELEKPERSGTFTSLSVIAGLVSARVGPQTQRIARRTRPAPDNRRAPPFRESDLKKGVKTCMAAKKGHGRRLHALPVKYGPFPQGNVMSRFCRDSPGGRSMPSGFPPHGEPSSPLPPPSRPLTARRPDAS